MATGATAATSKTQRRLLTLSGPIVTILLIVIVEALDRAGLQIPNATAIYLFGVVYAAVVGGLGPGLVSAALAIVGAALTAGPPGQPPLADPEDQIRLAALAVLAPATAVMTGLLRRRAERGLVVAQQADRLRERAAVSAALAESEARLRAILESAVDAIVTIDERGVIESVNPATERLFGYTAGELIGRNVAVLMPPPFRDEHDDYIARYLATGERRIIGLGRTVEGRHKDGSIFPLDLSVSEVGEAGPRRFVGILRDVTERKRAEQAVRESAARTHAILATAVDAIITIDERGIIESFNPAAERTFGYRAGEVVGRNVAILMPSPYREEHDGYLARHLATGERRIIGVGRQVEGRHKNGATFPMELAVSEVYLGDRRIFTGIVRDVSERVQAEAERVDLLRREQTARADAEATVRRANLLAEAGAALSASLDVEATLTALTRLLVPRLADWCVVDLLDDGQLHLLAAAHADPSKEDLIRRLRAAYPFDRLADRGLARVLRTGEPEFFPEIDPAWRESAARDPDHLGLMRSLDARSSIAVPLSARGRTLGALTLVMSESGRRYDEADLAMARELAQRAALALDNARLYEETQAALRARDTFLSVASHELRTPVTSIKGFVQVLMRHQERGRLDAEQLAAALPVIQRSADRLTGLIGDLLDVSRIQLGRLLLRLQPVDLVKLVRATVEAHPAQVDGRHLFGLTTEIGAAPMLADPDRLEQVLVNLLDNAVTYSPNGGAIDISVGADEGGWRISVRDHGIGLPPGRERAIFEPFGRAANAVEQQPAGLGLGLYISRMIVDQHGGRIWVESPGEGRGATAHIWLPRSPRADAEPPAPRPAAPGPPEEPPVEAPEPSAHAQIVH